MYIQCHDIIDLKSNLFHYYCTCDCVTSLWSHYFVPVLDKRCSHCGYHFHKKINQASVFMSNRQEYHWVCIVLRVFYMILNGEAVYRCHIMLLLHRTLILTHTWLTNNWKTVYFTLVCISLLSWYTIYISIVCNVLLLLKYTWCTCAYTYTYCTLYSCTLIRARILKSLLPLNPSLFNNRYFGTSL